MAVQLSVTTRSNQLTTLNTDIGANAVIKIFTGTQPTNCGTADTGTLLATFAGNAGGFGSVTTGVLTAAAVASVTAAASGTAGYFRVYPSAATTTNAVIQGTAGTSGTDMILTANPLTSGQTVNFTSLTYTRGGA
jgi:hypothetical protein